MTGKQSFKGVVTAVLTPFDQRGRPDLERLAKHIQTLEADGSDYLLIAGTTGEGPSLSAAERRVVLETAFSCAGNMRVMAQTGCASLEDTIHLTRHAFDLGVEVVTVLPPFFFKGVSEDGLCAYYQQVLDGAIPPDGKLMLYHIPQVTQVPITLSLVERLVQANGERIAGIKDSAGDLEHLSAYCSRFPQLSIFTGNDQLILPALRSGACGCVTGVVNTFAAFGAQITRGFEARDPQVDEIQRQFTTVWQILEKYQPYTSLLKGLLAVRYTDPGWLRVRPPLDPIPTVALERMVGELQQLDLPERYDWIREADARDMELEEAQ